MNTMPGPVRRAVTPLSPCNFEFTIIYTNFIGKKIRCGLKEKIWHQDKGSMVVSIWKLLAAIIKCGCVILDAIT